MAEILIPNKQAQCLVENKAQRISGSNSVVCRNWEECAGKARHNGYILCFMPMVEAMFSQKLPPALKDAFEKAKKEP